MYLRFTVPGRVTRQRVAPGLFGVAHNLWWAREHDTPALLALRQELDWFNDNLPVPRRFGVRAKGCYWKDGICWFIDKEREMVGHAHCLARLIEDSGVPVTRIWTRDPGQMLYRDRWQVVAKPERAMLH